MTEGLFPIRDAGVEKKIEKEEKFSALSSMHFWERRVQRIFLLPHLIVILNAVNS